MAPVAIDSKSVVDLDRSFLIFLASKRKASEDVASPLSSKVKRLRTESPERNGHVKMKNGTVCEPNPPIVIVSY